MGMVRKWVFDMSNGNVNRRRFLKTIGAVGLSVAASQTSGAQVDERDGDVLVQRPRSSPIAPEEIETIQAETLGGADRQIDVPEVLPGDGQEIVSYSQTIASDGIPEVYVGVVPAAGEPRALGASSGQADETVASRHRRAEQNLQSVSTLQTSGFVDYDEQWSRTLRSTYDSGSCPDGTMTTVLQVFTRSDLSKDNRAIMSRALTYPGVSDECNTDHMTGLGRELDFRHDWNDNDWNVSSPTITDRDAEDGEENSSGSVTIGYAGASLTAPLSGPDTEKSDESTSDHAAWNYFISQSSDASYGSAIHSAGSVAEWDDSLPSGAQMFSMSTEFRVMDCTVIVPINGCTGRSFDSFGTTVNVSTA